MFDTVISFEDNWNIDEKRLKILGTHSLFPVNKIENPGHKCRVFGCEENTSQAYVTKEQGK